VLRCVRGAPAGFDAPVARGEALRLAGSALAAPMRCGAEAIRGIKLRKELRTGQPWWCGGLVKFSGMKWLAVV